MAQAYKGLNWNTIDGSGNLTASIMSDRYGTELFGLFIVLALIVTAVEMILSRKL